MGRRTVVASAPKALSPKIHADPCSQGFFASVPRAERFGDCVAVEGSPLSGSNPYQTRTPMARKPNYSFERQERERAAAIKAAEKAAAKAERKADTATEKAPPAED
jgi:hypothetical protein